MNMDRSLRILFVGLSIIATVAAQRPDGKIAFDVKTHIGEKATLSLAKSGVISYLKQTPWAVVVEGRENYALWLKNYDKGETGTKARIELDLEVQTPKLIGEGPVKAQRHLVVEYDLAAGFDKFSPEQRKAAMDLQNTRAMNAVMVTVGGAVVGGLVIKDRDDRKLVTDAIFFASDDLKRKPTIEEIVESLSVGATVVSVLDTMRLNRQF